MNTIEALEIRCKSYSWDGKKGIRTFKMRDGGIVQVKADGKIVDSEKRV